MKKAVFMLAAFSLIIALAACGGSGGVKDDVAVEDLIAKIRESVSLGDKMMAVDDNYLTNIMQIEKGVAAEHVVMLSTTGTSIDEIGIFKGSDKSKAGEIAKEIEAYLKMRDDTWMEAYMPEERPKIQSAEYKSIGNYVMYAILDDSEKAEAFKVFEDELGA